MAREIKFRAWDLIIKEMYWVDGKFDSELLQEIAEGKHPEIILMQYTGLKDKNGKEIYEGDIIDVTGRMDDYEIYAVVEWDNEEARFGYCKRDGDDTEVGSLYELLDPKRNCVIGNVYENPGLISTKE